MAPGDPIPPDRTIYRAIRKKQLSEDGESISEIAYLLKPAHGEWPDETYLSFGVNVAGAKAGLQNIKHAASILVEDVLALGLQVTEDEDPQKVQVSGMPLETVDVERAWIIAKQLRDASTLLDAPD